MSKRLKKTISCVLALTTASTALLAAGCRKEGTAINKNMTQLWVQNYNGGFGSEWLDEAMKSFAEKYANESFEDGKKGVQFMPDYTKSIDKNLKTSEYEVFFTDSVDYIEGVAAGNFLELTDIMQTNLPGENKTIEAKLYPEQKEYLTSIDGKYYAIPHYERTSSFIYDIDLFEKEKLYFAADKSEYDFILTPTQTRSAGPDGRLGSYDDGLPSTVEEYGKLFAYMVSKNITPLIWSGDNVNYVKHVIRALSATMAGKDQYNVRYTLSGEIEIVNDYQNMTTKKETITKSNAYLIAQQKSDYDALRFLDILFSNEAYYDLLSLSGSLGHLEAQEQYIYSSLENKPIAMLIESNYWLNEASDALQRSIDDYGEQAKNRRFGYMPLPGVYSGTVTEANAKNQTMVQLQSSYSFINATIASNPKKIRLAKLFLQHCYTDKTLLDFTKVTNTIKPMQYPYEQALDSLNSFAKSTYNVRKNADMVFGFTTDEIFRQNVTVIPELTSRIGNVSYSQPVDAFKKGHRAKEYFTGMQMDKTTWETSFSKYFD